MAEECEHRLLLGFHVVCNVVPGPGFCNQRGSFKDCEYRKKEAERTGKEVPKTEAKK